MRVWSCGVCGQMVFFDSSTCLGCGSLLRLRPDRRDLVAVEDVAGGLVPVGEPGARPWARCANDQLAGCNWLVDPAEDGDGLCMSCRLTVTRPDDADLDARRAFADAEAAKRRLVFQLAELGLPVTSRREDPRRGLGFDLLSSSRDHVVTGHADGLITLDLAEADDAYRTRMRQQLGEPYRTVLGHFRHESGHYYWTVLVEGTSHLDRCRAMFGDDRLDYAAALERHYSDGPPPDWQERHVSAYATMHPAEDWAETFAHYLHICDTLQTAGAFGVTVAGPRDARTVRRAPAFAAVPGDVGGEPGFGGVLAEWLPLTYALNAINRSMGEEDLYPFVLAPAVVDKLAFVHELVTGRAGAVQR